MSDDDIIGFGKPPKANRFRPGVCPNPKGRPKGSKNITTYVREAAYKQIVVTQNGARRKMTRVKAAVEQLANKAAAGDNKSILQLLDYVAELEQRDAARANDVPIDEADRRVLHEVHQRLQVYIPLPAVKKPEET
jgi:hypothetical protein